MEQAGLIKDKQEFIRNASRFFEKLFGENPGDKCGDIEIRTFPKSGFREQHFCGETQEAARLSYDLCNSGVDVYFGVNPRIGKRGKKENVQYVVVVHAEIDYGQDGHKKHSEYETYEQTLSAIQNFELKPTLVNHSGGGFHCYWVLREPVKVKDKGVNTLESINKSLSEKLGGDSATKDISRILRVPGTFNFKLECNPREVTAVITDGPKYDFGEFIPFTETPKFGSKPARPNAPVEPVSVENEGVNQDSVSSLPVSEKIRNLILHGNDGTYPSRSEADFAVIAALLNKGQTPSQIREIFRTYPIGEKYRDHKAPEKYLDHSIESAKKLSNLTEEEISDPLFISGSIQKNGEEYSLDVLKFQEYMTRKNRLKYLEDESAFFRYTGKCFEHLKEDSLNSMCQKELGDHRKHFRSSTLREFCHFGRGDALVYSQKAKNDRVRYLTLQNGLYDLHLGKLVPHSPDIFTTNLLPYDHDPQAQCPRFLQYLDEVFMGDKEVIGFVQEAVGYSFHKSVPSPAMFMLIGGGSNGKSVFVNLLTDLIGEENTCSISLNALGKEYYVLDLFGKMINVSSETPKRKYINTDTVKAVVGGDWVTGREPYKHPMKFKPFAKHFLAMNEVPMIEDNTHGMMRRLYFVEFPRTFKNHEMDVYLSDKLRKELSGIFNWAMEGYKRLSEKGFMFNESKSMRQSKQNYKNHTNSASAFASQCFEKGSEDDLVKFSDLYESYVKFCKTEGYDTIFQKPDFRRNLEKEGFRVEKSTRHANQLYVFEVVFVGAGE